MVVGRFSVLVMWIRLVNLDGLLICVCWWMMLLVRLFLLILVSVVVMWMLGCLLRIF